MSICMTILPLQLQYIPVVLGLLAFMKIGDKLFMDNSKEEQ